VVDVPDRPDIDVRLAPIKFFFRHRRLSFYTQAIKFLAGCLSRQIIWSR